MHPNTAVIGFNGLELATCSIVPPPAFTFCDQAQVRRIGKKRTASKLAAGSPQHERTRLPAPSAERIWPTGVAGAVRRPRTNLPSIAGWKVASRHARSAPLMGLRHALLSKPYCQANAFAAEAARLVLPFRGHGLQGIRRPLAGSGSLKAVRDV